MARFSRGREGERGITILLVAIAMISILAMAALAVDLVALYTARAETQRAADAAALAAAKMFVFSGYTSNSSIISQTQLCATVSGTASTAAANQAAQSALSQNPVVGQVATLQAVTCDFSHDLVGTTSENPQVTVTVQRTGLPTFFGRIWGAGAGSVSATASAEAFNPSSGTPPPPSPGGLMNIAVGSVKPWLIANDCSGGPSCVQPGPYYFDSSYGIANSGDYMGAPTTFTIINAHNGEAPTRPSQFYALDGPQPNVCPSSSALQCSGIGTGPPGIFYHDNIACSNTAFQYSCGQQISDTDLIKIDTRTPGALAARTQPGVECLIHAASADLGQGQDVINTGPPVTIDGGTNNPNPALQSVSNISRSDSVVTVPVYAGGDPICGSGGCANAETVIGFLQLGIQAVSPSAWAPGPPFSPPPPPGPPLAGSIQAVILNAAPCNPANGGSPPGTATPVVGGALSPIPVRLIRQ